MDTIIWLDGHTSKISSKEANSKSYNIITRGRYEFRLILQNSEFAWIRIHFYYEFSRKKMGFFNANN